MSGTTIKDVLIAAETAERSGDLPRAAQLYREILTRMPKHSRAKKALSKIERKGGGGKPRMGQGEANQLLSILQQGNFAGALEFANQLIANFRDEPFVYNIIGYAQTQLGDTDAAAKAYRWAIKLDPNFVEAQGNLGALLVQMGQSSEAVNVLRKAVGKKSNYHEAHHNLGLAQMALEKWEAAKSAFDRALELKPDYANAYNSRGNLLKQTGELAGAKADYEAALRLVPGDTVAIDNLAELYATLGDVDRALNLTEQLIGVAPDNLEYLRRRAVQLNTLGRREEAIGAFQQVLEKFPQDGETVASLLTLSQEAEKSVYRARAVELAEALLKDSRDYVLLGYSLAADAEKHKDIKTSGTWLSAANGAYHQSLPPLPISEGTRFDQAYRMFKNGVPDRLKGYGDETQRPIFIVGMMRSGTTLVEQILSSHSLVYGAGELEAATKFGTPVMENGKKASAKDLRGFCESYLSVLNTVDTDHPHTTDKMPANFFMVGLLHAAFPNAKIINTVRDPRDTCFSIWKNFFDTQAHQYAYDQAELAAFANNYKGLMNFWDEVLPGVVYHARYEDIVADQEGTSRKLLDHVGLEWEQGVLDFHKTKRAVRTASVNQVRQKIYTSSVKSWAPYQDHLKVLLDGLDKDLWADAFANEQGLTKPGH